MKNITFLALAQNELDDIYEALEHQKKDQGYQYIQEIKKMLSLIKTYPTLWSKISENTYKCLIKGFPYAIIYQQIDNLIIVVAIMSLHKKPIHWASKSVSEYATCRISSLPETMYTR